MNKRQKKKKTTLSKIQKSKQVKAILDLSSKINRINPASPFGYIDANSLNNVLKTVNTAYNQNKSVQSPLNFVNKIHNQVQQDFYKQTRSKLTGKQLNAKYYKGITNTLVNKRLNSLFSEYEFKSSDSKVNANMIDMSLYTDKGQNFFQNSNIFNNVDNYLQDSEAFLSLFRTNNSIVYEGLNSLKDIWKKTYQKIANSVPYNEEDKLKLKEYTAENLNKMFEWLDRIVNKIDVIKNEDLLVELAKIFYRYDIDEETKNNVKYIKEIFDDLNALAQEYNIQLKPSKDIDTQLSNISDYINNYNNYGIT